jgi:hypothetical protein
VEPARYSSAWITPEDFWRNSGGINFHDPRSQYWQTKNRRACLGESELLQGNQALAFTAGDVQTLCEDNENNYTRLGNIAQVFICVSNFNPRQLRDVRTKSPRIESRNSIQEAIATDLAGRRA